MKTLILCLVAGALMRAEVPYARITDPAQHGGDWLTYSGNYQGHRSSPLREITPANVSNLRVRWAYQFPNGRTAAPQSLTAPCMSQHWTATSSLLIFKAAWSGGRQKSRITSLVIA